MVTIKDVARVAGVSIAAVSYVVNGKEGVNKENRKKIMQTIKEMGYVPNQQARNLVGSSSNIIAVIISDVTTAYNSELIKYIEEHAHSLNKQIMLGCSSGDVEKEKFLLEKFIAQSVGGIILFPTKEFDAEVYKKNLTIINNCDIPIAIVSQPIDEFKCKFMDIDYAGGMYKVTKYFLDNGITDIAFFSTIGKNIYSYQKERGFILAMAEHNINSQNKIYRYDDEEDYESGRRTVNMFLSEHKLPQAIIAINDISAIGMIRELKSRGIKFPRDITIAGFGGIELVSYFDYNLTTAGFNRDVISKKCLDTLFGNNIRCEKIELNLMAGDIKT